MNFYQLEPKSKYGFSIHKIDNLLEVGDGEFYTMEHLQEQYAGMMQIERHQPAGSPTGVIYLLPLIKIELEDLVKKIEASKKSVRMPDDLPCFGIGYNEGILRGIIPHGYRAELKRIRDKDGGYSDYYDHWFLIKEKLPGPPKIRTKPVVNDYRLLVYKCISIISASLKGATRIDFHATQEDKEGLINLLKKLVTFEQVAADYKCTLDNLSDDLKRYKIIWDNPAYFNKKEKTK